MARRGGPITLGLSWVGLPLRYVRTGHGKLAHGVASSSYQADYSNRSADNWDNRTPQPCFMTSRCVRILAMEQPQQQPLHWDTAKSSLNITLILSVVVIVLGLVQGINPLLLVLGLAGAAWGWFTNARQYYIYPDALLIAYGRPRVKAYRFDDIEYLEMLVMPTGNRLRLRMANGQRVVISAKNIDEFRDRFDEALENYRGPNDRPRLPDESSAGPPPYGSAGGSADDAPPY